MTKRQAPKWTDVPLEIEPARASRPRRKATSGATQVAPAVVALSQRMTPLDALGRVSEELAAAERDRLALVARRDELVTQLRAEGATWVALARAAGTSRQALMKRG